MVIRLAAGLLAGLLFCVSGLRADIVFGTGNSSAANNVGSFTQLTSFTAKGSLLGNGLDVLQAQADVALQTPAAGAARLEAVTNLFTSVVFTPIGPQWDVIEFNVQNDKTNGTFVLKAIDDGGTEWISGSFTLGNGQNRVWAEAINGQSIAKITVLASGSLIHNIRQVRLTQAAAVPEPGSVILAGLAWLTGMGFAGRRKRRHPAWA